jgi:hypothetical protein
VIGNLVIGQRYCEPQGNCKFTCETTGEFVDVEFKVRGAWSTKPEDINYATAIVKTRAGVPKYKLYGKYTDCIMAVNLETNEEFECFRAPVFPEPPQAIERTYGMNLYAL